MARGSKRGVFRQLMKSEDITRVAAKHIGLRIRKEIKVLCSDKHNSLLRERTQTSMELFTWESLWLELQEVAPLTILLLQSSIPYKSSTTLKTRSLICTIIASLSKSRNKRMNALQSMVSLILYAGHAGKQVGAQYMIQDVTECNFALYIHTMTILWLYAGLPEAATFDDLFITFLYAIPHW